MLARSHLGFEPWRGGCHWESFADPVRRECVLECLGVCVNWCLEGIMATYHNL